MTISHGSDATHKNLSADRHFFLTTVAKCSLTVDWLVDVNTWQNTQKCFWGYFLQPKQQRYFCGTHFTMTHTQTHKLRTLPADVVAAGNYSTCNCVSLFNQGEEWLHRDDQRVHEAA